MATTLERDEPIGATAERLTVTWLNQRRQGDGGLRLDREETEFVCREVGRLRRFDLSLKQEEDVKQAYKGMYRLLYSCFSRFPRKEVPLDVQPRPIAYCVQDFLYTTEKMLEESGLFRELGLSITARRFGNWCVRENKAIRKRRGVTGLGQRRWLIFDLNKLTNEKT